MKILLNPFFIPRYIFHNKNLIWHLSDNILGLHLYSMGKANFPDPEPLYPERSLKISFRGDLLMGNGS
jgi:hypothetical protein